MPAAEVIRTVGAASLRRRCSARRGRGPGGVEPRLSDSAGSDRRRVWALELFHGPTLAFKDVGARFMARLMGHAVESAAGTRARRQAPDAARARRGRDHVLVATSGDTGSAVARAFLGVPGFRVVVLFPDGRISEPQRKLITTLGGNVSSLAVAGSFDDCQRLVKEAFADADLRGRGGDWRRPTRSTSGACCRRFSTTSWPWRSFRPARRRLSSRHRAATSATSPPASTPSDLGLPVERFVAATNVNDVMPEYLETGVFRPRPSRGRSRTRWTSATRPTSSASARSTAATSTRCAPTSPARASPTTR